MAENSVDGLVKEIQTENERLKHFIDNYSIDQTDGPSDYVEIWNQKVVTILEKIPVVSTSIETKKNNIIQSLERTETELDGLKKTVTDLWDQINQFDSNAEKYKLQLKEEIIKIQRKSKTIKEQYTKKNGDLEKEVKNLNVKLRKTTKLERDLSKVTKENEKYKEEIDELYQHKSDLEDEIIKYKTLLNQLTNKVNTTDETPEDTSPGNNQPEQPDDPSDGREPETENPSGNNDEPNAAPTDPDLSREQSEMTLPPSDDQSVNVDISIQKTTMKERLIETSIIGDLDSIPSNQDLSKGEQSEMTLPPSDGQKTPKEDKTIGPPKAEAQPTSNNPGSGLKHPKKSSLKFPGLFKKS